MPETMRDSHPEDLDEIRLSVFYEHLREAAEQTGSPLEDLLAEASAVGIRGIEMEFSTLIQKPELHHVIKRFDMEISNLYQFYDFGNNYAAGMQTGREMVDTAENMSIQRIMIIPGFLKPEQARALNQVSASYEETSAFMNGNAQILAMRDAIAELTEYAAKRDIMVSIEDFDAFDSPIARINHIRWFLAQVPGLKHTLDMGNYCFSNESVEEAYELFKDRIAKVKHFFLWYGKKFFPSTVRSFFSLR